MGDMVKGNIAMAEAAMRAGVVVYAGYPITPSTEVMEYLSGRMPELGRTFIQAESELAAINMVLGVGACGRRVLTASSGPGILLKQEGISYICLGQMMEPCEYPEFRELGKCSWGLDGTYKVRRGDFLGRDLVKESDVYMEKLRAMRENEQRWQELYTEDAEYVFVAIGLPGRAAEGIVRELREKGEKVGLIRPISVWPYPDKAFAELAAKNPGVKGFITVETNGEGQMVDDVALCAKRHGMGAVPVYALAYVCDIPKDEAVKRDFARIKAGEVKEVY